MYEAHAALVVPAPILDLQSSVLAFVSDDSLAELGLSRHLPFCFFTGHCLLNEAVAYAHAYAGHQFGQWAGQLGDGRAVQIGQVRGFELSIKGVGRTPFSRRGDGVAVLRSSVRELVALETLRALAVPASRALALAIDQRAPFVPRDPRESGTVLLERPASVMR